MIEQTIQSISKQYPSNMPLYLSLLLLAVLAIAANSFSIIGTRRITLSRSQVTRSFLTDSEGKLHNIINKPYYNCS